MPSTPSPILRVIGLGRLITAVDTVTVIITTTDTVTELTCYCVILGLSLLVDANWYRHRVIVLSYRLPYLIVIIRVPIAPVPPAPPRRDPLSCSRPPGL